MLYRNIGKEHGNYYLGFRGLGFRLQGEWVLPPDRQMSLDRFVRGSFAFLELLGDKGI